MTDHCPCPESAAPADLRGWGYGSDWRVCAHSCPHAVGACQDAPTAPRGERKRWRRAMRGRGVCATSPADWRASDILDDLLADDADAERRPAKSYACGMVNR